MFDAPDHAYAGGASGIEMRLPQVLSGRAGWHPRSRPLVSVDRDLLESDVDEMSAEEALGALVELQAHVARLHERETRLLVRAAGATRVVRSVQVEEADDDGRPIAGRDPREVQFVDEVVDEIAAALNRSCGQVQKQIDVARLLDGPMRATRELLAAGRISLAHASVIADQSERLQAAPLGVDPEGDRTFEQACRALEDRVLGQAARETVSQTRSRARRVVASIDPAGAEARRRRAKAHCDVTGRGLDDGLALIEAVLPALDAARILATVEAQAHAAVADGSIATLDLAADAKPGQIRAAVFARMVLQADPCVAPTADSNIEIQVMIDAASLAGLNPGGPAWVQVGSGQPVDVSRTDLVELLADPSTHATMRRLVTDPTSGALVDRGSRSYRVSDSLRAWITARDVTCTQPGCTRPAVRCDVDHSVDFVDGGRTTIANTKALCRRHHNRKTHSGWRIEDSKPDGSCVFVSPTGRRYRHWPVDLTGGLPPLRASAPQSPPSESSDDPPGF